MFKLWETTYGNWPTHYTTLRSDISPTYFQVAKWTISVCAHHLLTHSRTHALSNQISTWIIFLDVSPLHFIIPLLLAVSDYMIANLGLWATRQASVERIRKTKWKKKKARDCVLSQQWISFLLLLRMVISRVWIRKRLTVVARAPSQNFLLVWFLICVCCDCFLLS